MSTRIMQINISAVRHLTWCLFSQPLAKLNSAQALHINTSEPLTKWLDSLNENPSHLLAYIQQSNHRLLGSYFECLWQYFFKYSPDTELLAHHVQVTEQLKNGKRTLGELDILTLINQKPFHVELAVKFYLLAPNETGQLAKHWIGPQTQDRLDLKLDTLNQKQIPFLHHPTTQGILKERGLGQTFDSAVIMKGYLFSPFNKDYLLPSECEATLNASLDMGQWLHASDIDLILNFHSCGSQWSIIDKHNWLGPFYTAENKESQTELLSLKQVKSEVLIHFNHHTEHKIPYALMLANMGETSSNEGIFIEHRRYFVVPDGWPFNLANRG
jgi:hypothetical protein